MIRYVDWFDVMLYWLGAACVALLIALVGSLMYQAHWEATHDQAHWEATHDCVATRMERRGAYTTIIPAGKVLVPVFHPARDVTVCDKWVDAR